MAERSSRKRELIDTGRNKMFGKHDAQGRFKEMDEVWPVARGGSPQNRQDDSQTWEQEQGTARERL
jgi:hypothetical protein